MEELIREAIRELIYKSIEIETLNEAKYQGRNVPLSKKMRDDSGKKKFKVYVKNPKTGNVKVIRFGDPNMRIKKIILNVRKVLEQDINVILLQEKINQQ